MLGRGPESGPDAGHHGEWHFHLAAEHIAHLGGVVDQLVHADADEVDEHQFGYGPESG